MTSEYSIPVREIPIATLGQAKIPSPLPYGNMINTGKVMLSLSHEYDEDIDTHQTLLFEEAGPRQELYFDPGKTKCSHRHLRRALPRPQRRDPGHCP